MSKPQRILMLAFPDCQMLDVTGPLQMFAGVNDELGRQAYELVIAAPKRGPFKTSSSVSLVADLAIADVSPAKCRTSDTLIAAGGDPGLRRALESDEIAALIKAASRRGCRIVSVCTGTFFLAAAGLLDGRRAATHWRYVERLRRFRPRVDVDPEAIYLRDGNIWTSAGVTAGIDLALALIEADFGRSIALAVARRHVVFRIRPGGQGQFSTELAAQGIRDHRLSKLAEKIAEGPQENWRTDTLAAEAGVSLRSLSRLFRKELNASPSEFVERVRIDQARRALLETEAQIESVAIRCGFGSLRRMDRAFSRAISATPTEFRARFKPSGASA
jgi:transcriptional regulator GlxA family with amidase domain